MALRGRFGDTSGRPYLEGLLYLPRLNIKSNVSFLVDTGADRSILHPLDGQRVGLDYSSLQGHIEATGTNGVAGYFEEQALLIFTESGRNLHAYRIDVLISPPGSEIMDLPSLLGRDILKNWRMMFNPSKNRLVFNIIQSDITIPLK